MKTKTRKHAHKKDTTSCYKATKNGMLWRNGKGESVYLSNFKARIIADITRNDGAVTERLYDIEVTLKGMKTHVFVQASKFHQMQWVSEQVGAAATISAGYTIKDHLRTAIQSLSIPSTRTFYSHLGWKKYDGKWIYVHAGGSIGTTALMRIGVKVDVKDLPSYVLPEQPSKPKLRSAIKASLSILEVAPRRLTYALLAAAYRAPLAEALSCDFSLLLAGQSGCQKSELTALVQAHFGRDFCRVNLPANWTDTTNALEKKSFLAKDAIMTIDDFAPCGTQNEVLALHAKADRVLRGQGNQRGRGRMTASCELTKDYYPRGLIIFSGEDVPKGNSLGARFLTLEVQHGDVELNKLTELQERARDGDFASAMAGYIEWLSHRMDDLKTSLPKRRDELRSELRKARISHDRTPGNIASLASGLEMFLTFAVEAGAIDGAERERLWEDGWKALQELGKQQREQHLDSNPAEMFLRLLRAAISSGKCHLKDKDGRYADNPEVWGWTKIGGEEEYPDYRSQGDCIGWTDGDDIFLEPTSSFKIAQLMGQNGSGTLPIGLKTLNKRLKEAGLLATTDETRGTATVRKTLQDQVRDVLHMRSDAFWGKTAEE